MIGRFLCWCGLHVPPAGVDPAWSLYWYCHRCGHISPGDISRRRK